MTDEELDEALRRRARSDVLLRAAIERMDALPYGGASYTRVAKEAMLELSRKAAAMQKVAERLLALSPQPVVLGAMVERAKRKVDGGDGFGG